MAKVFATVKAVFTRVIFASHGFLAIWQVTQSKKDPVWWTLCIPIGLLVLEALFTLTIKKNQEWRWFCPSVFLYLSSVVPAIWLLELNKMERRLRMTNSEDDLALRPPNFKDLDKLLGNQFIKIPDIRVDSSTWITLIEQFLMLILIIGRWMLPKGELSRDELSQLLLVYIGTAADIIEFFDSFKDNTIANDRLLVFLTLGIWSWSLLQFTIVLSATRARKPRGGLTINKYSPSSSANCCCNIDSWGIFLNIILQDAPFLAFRLLIIIEYKIITYMNVFFACKNTLVIMLQLYRLVVVHAEGRKAHKLEKAKQMEIFAISGGRKRQSSERDKNRRVVEANKPKRKKPDTGYSTDSSESSSSSSSEPSVAVTAPAKKKNNRRKGQEKGASKSSVKRKEVDRPSNRQKKKKPEKIVVVEVEEEGTVTDSVSISEVAVVEVVKEKKNKRKKHHRKASSGSSD